MYSNYRGFLYNGLTSDYLPVGQVDGYSANLTAGVTYTLDVISATEPLDMSLAGPQGIIRTFTFVQAGTLFTYTAPVSGQYGIGIDTAMGAPGSYAMTTNSFLIAPAPVVATPRLAAPPDFDIAYYLAHNPDVAAAGVDPVLHYESSGWKEGRNPDALFNTNYYLARNPDVAAAGVDPLLHYETIGWKEGRDPSDNFSTSAYLLHNPDVAAAGIDPLAQYLHNGIVEGRMIFVANPHGVGPQDPLVDNTYYFAQNADVRAAGINPFTDYETNGWHEGRNPDALFNTAYYLQQNPDVKAAGMDPLLHYEQFGWKEGRDPSADFSTDKYLAANADVRAAGMDPLVHYLDCGIHEGRAIYHA
jgi:hypothetical protein